MSQAEAPVEVGQMLAGKYRIDRVLGAGGMGVVVAATHVQLDQKVAIKFLLPVALASADVVARFQREARACVKITSEHVARVIDVGTLDTGAPYMVMEYLEGTDLAHRITEGQLSVREAVRFVLEACEALAEAHAAGIIHRDLKPANLYLARRADKTSMVKVLDFGISKTVTGGVSGGAMTSTQAVMGSPYYMSPEQLMSAKHVDARADIWSLGVVLYESLTGSPPYLGDTMPEIVAQILQAPVKSVSAQRPDVPPSVDRIIAKAMNKDVNQRYRDVAAFARDLADLVPDGMRSVDRIARVLGTSVPPPAIDMGSAPTAPLGTMSPLHESNVSSQPRDSKGGTIAMNRALHVQGASGATSQPQEAWGATNAGLPGVPKKSSAPLIAAIVAGAALVLGGVVFVVSMSGAKHKGEPQQSQSIVESHTATADPTQTAALQIAPPPPQPQTQGASPPPPPPTQTQAPPPNATHVTAHGTTIAKTTNAPPPPSATPKATVVAAPPAQTSHNALDMGIK